MNDRIAYQIESLPPGENREDLITYLESQPEYGELTLYAASDSLAMTIPRMYAYQYKDLFLEVIPLNNQLIITCHKISLELLNQKYDQVRKKLFALNTYLSDFDKELRLKEYHTRHSTRLYLINCVNALKRDIKTELKGMGIHIKPGSGISKLLRVNYLPEKFLKTLFVLVICLFLSGCATIFKQKERSVAVDSKPQGAEIYINDLLMGTTPRNLILSNLKSIVIVFKLIGYENKTVYIPTSVTFGWAVLDCLGGMIPIFVDAASSNWNNLDTKSVQVVLDQSAGN